MFRSTVLGGGLSKAVVLLCLVCLVSRCVHTQDDLDYEYGAYDYGDDIAAADDDLGYYSDDNQQFYNEYGYYPDEYDGYDFYGDYTLYDDCTTNSNGKPVLSNSTTACPIKIVGVNKQAPNLTGGIDGVYEIVSCYNGKPMYRRKNTTSTAGESRVLWYSNQFTDWDISTGTEPNEATIVMYGGENEHAPVPLLVSTWKIGADLLKKANATAKHDEYAVVKVKLLCADGTKLDVKTMKKRTAENKGTGPMLTNEEFDDKYNEIFERFGTRPEPNPTVNFTFVVLLVMIGLTIILAIPYFLMKQKAGPKASISTSFTQMLQQSKKKQSGHAL